MQYFSLRHAVEEWLIRRIRMLKFGEKHPLAFEFVLIVLSFAAAALFSIAGNMFNLHPDFSTSAGRIIVGTALLIIYRSALRGRSVFTHPLIVLPALLFPAWNIFYNLSSGMTIGGIAFFVEGILTAMAPALFEEVIFRGIFISNLRKDNKSSMYCLFVTAAVFALLHLTNIVGMDMISVLVQFGYSFVIGLVLAAVYLKNGSLLQVVIVHFLIDFTSRIFVEQASISSIVHLILFSVLLAAEAVYAVVITGFD